MKKPLFSFLKKEQKKENLNRKEIKTVNSEFAKGISLEESFEEMFPGEIPDEVKVYDLKGNEVK